MCSCLLLIQNMNIVKLLTFIYILFDILQFFNQVMMLGNTADSEVGEKLTDVLFELYQTSPPLITAIIPFLDQKLKVLYILNYRIIGTPLSLEKCWLRDIHRFILVFVEDKSAFFLLLTGIISFCQQMFVIQREH